MELRHLRYFTVLADTLHFGQAAARLNIVQPALSMQIRKLEEELGVALFERSRRKVALTPTGELFLIEARRCLSHADQARFLAQEAKRGAIGQLRLGLSNGAVQSGALRRVMRAFRASSPGLLIEPVEVHPAGAADAIFRGDIDASLGTTASLALPEGLESYTMAQHRALVVLPEEHPLAAEADIPAEALRGETFIGYAGPHDVMGMSLTVGALGYLPAAQRAVSSPSMTVGMVAAGLGVAIVPESIARPEAGAVFRGLRDRRFDIDVTLLWSGSQSASTAAAIARMLAEEP
ncbi:LysR substrate-binding domain-containing protein [Roseicyclus sp. F158]|uniref:LysR substrate-binding domain-containing protein n=1 Tax=Tropicimonas omnivorans TaxID=3075590 RepID=A0ABU3DHK1_9RHOB|nr:LysR substrate-binding domain-containing protein [Roseicyclus sp. F158]MDT0683186.1 LysR substrate-binding domain-containing protein [Roseicyclus sp. F158]